MRVIRLSWVVPVAAAALVLAGCAPVPISAPTRSSSLSSHSASPTPTSTPTAAKPALDDLTIGPDGIGNLVIGQPVPEVDPAVALVRWDPQACAPSDRPGAWVANYPDVTAGPWGGSWPFGIVTEAGQKDASLAFILVTASVVGTAKGIHVGSTPAEVIAAYPAGLSTLHGEDSDVYYVKGTRGILQMEIPHEDGTVTALSVIGAGTAPFGMYGGDGGAPCSA